MKTLNLLVMFLLAGFCFADCPLDHFLIGCNPDGIDRTDDDKKLFVDCTQKYRHSDPMHSGDPTWLNRHYPLYYNIRYDRYQVGEPGFDVITHTDPNQALVGVRDKDYRIIIECVSLSPGFVAKNTTYGILLDTAGASFNHSSFADSHIHLEYRAPAPGGATDMQWITFVMYDELGRYEQSEPFSVVFVADALDGDLVIDGVVDLDDMYELVYYWLRADGGRANDYYERADIDMDGKVDFADFAMLAGNWVGM